MIDRLRRFVGRHERLAIAAYLVVFVSVFGLFVVRSFRHAILDRVEAGVDWWDDRWERAVEAGERLVAAERFEEAAVHLAALDERFPARHVKHARDRERERLLAALAASYEALGQKRMALGTLARLAQFDPRNYRSQLALGLAAERLDEPELAQGAFAAVLRVHPMEPRAFRGLVNYHFEQGEAKEVVSAYDRYLDALVLSRVGLGTDQEGAFVHVPVDGRFHDIEVVLPASRECDAVSIDTEGLSVEIDRVGIETAATVGGVGGSRVEVASADAEWELADFEPTPSGSLRATGPASRATLHLHGTAGPVVRLRARVRLFKPLDPASWQQVRTSYRNLLDFDGLEAAERRTVVCPPVAPGGEPCPMVTWPGDI